jgi:hypothetical protein
MQLLLSVIGALLLFVLYDFNDRLKEMNASIGTLQQNVEFIRGGLVGPLRP